MTQASPGLSLDVAADIHARLGSLEQKLDRDRARRLALHQKIIPLRIPMQSMTLTGSSPSLLGTLDDPQVFGPANGWVWELNGAGAQGFSTGTVGLYLNSTSDAQIASIATAGVPFYQRRFRYLAHGERVVWSASSITGTVSVWLCGMAYTEDIAPEIYS